MPRPVPWGLRTQQHRPEDLSRRGEMGCVEQDESHTSAMGLPNRRTISLNRPDFFLPESDRFAHLGRKVTIADAPGTRRDLENGRLR